MAALLVSELRNEVDGELHIVIDDYHQAIASDELNRTLDYLLANLPDNVHVILLSRFQPAVATARLKLDDQIGEVTFEDLRLDARTGRSSSSPNGPHAPTARPGRHGWSQLTEGWPASLVLISRALDWTNLGSIEHALVDPRLTSDVFSYLSEEAFRREDADTVAFMLATCCLDSMTIELADTVARTDHGQRSLERLVAHNVFTFVDRATGTYRYHQLLRDYLRQWYANEYGAGAFRDLQLQHGRRRRRRRRPRDGDRALLRRQRAGRGARRRLAQRRARHRQLPVRFAALVAREAGPERRRATIRGSCSWPGNWR